MTLDHEDIDAIASAVVAKLRSVEPERMLDAAELAQRLGISKAAVWRNARQLGGVQVGGGSRPRWRFELSRALAAQSDEQKPASVQPPRRSPRRTDVPLLPVAQGQR